MRVKILELSKVLHVAVCFSGTPREWTYDQITVARIKDPLFLTIIGRESNGYIESILLPENEIVTKVHIVDCG